jgi:acetoin utilization protein AcuC
LLHIYADENIGNIGFFEKDWFQPQVRQQALLDAIAASSIAEQICLCPAPLAHDEDIFTVHNPDYVQRVRHLSAQNVGALDDGATFARAHYELASRYVVGAVMDATRRILSGELNQAFVPIAGFHHAQPTKAEDYCLYNDCSIALTHALKRIEGQVGYIDIDVHFGNGVYDFFTDNPRVIFADIHESDRTLFPNDPEHPAAQCRRDTGSLTGTGEARGTKLVLALEPFQTDDDYARYFDAIEAHLARHNPSFILFESGLDGMDGDPLGHQSMTEDGIYRLTRRVKSLAQRYANGRLLVVGGGGYALKNNGPGWLAVVRALCES